MKLNWLRSIKIQLFHKTVVVCCLLMMHWLNDKGTLREVEAKGSRIILINFHTLSNFKYDENIHVYKERVKDSGEEDI